MSVGPGEVIQLPEEGTFLIGLKGSSWFACSEISSLPWVIDIGMEGQSKNKTFSFRPHPDRQNFDGHLGYSIQLKCSSENDECAAQEGHKITLPSHIEARSDTNEPEVIFKIKGITKSDSKRGSYSWGALLTNFITSSLQLDKDDDARTEIMA